MSLTLMTIVGLLTAVEFLYIIWSLDNTLLLKALGYKMYLDIVFGLGTTVYFAMTGTISGVAIAAISGAIFSLSLLVASKVCGSMKFDKESQEWIKHEPEWNVTTITSWFSSLQGKALRLTQNVKAGIAAANDDSVKVVA